MQSISTKIDAVTVRRERFTRTPTATAFVITVVDGPDAGLVVTIDATGPNRALIGNSPVCTIKLTDREVSRRHAALSVSGNVLQLLDLGSTNGTTVNGVIVREVGLIGGEAIRVGSTVLSVKRAEARAANIGDAKSFGKVLGSSLAMRRVYPALAQLVASDRAALIEGEAGTGKEMVAEEIHRSSRGAESPFVTLEAQNLPAATIGAKLLELVEQARGGMLFIDEVGALPRDVQTTLREIIATRSDVRIVCATRRDLDRDVQSGRFDDDLFFVLAAGRVELPPLRERDGDVAHLAKSFWKELGGEKAALSPETSELPEDFLPRFEHYPWPGNVRELKSAVLARMTLGELGASYRTSEAKEAGLDFLTSVIEEDLPFPAARERVVGEFERRYVERVLARHNGNVTQAARASGVAHRYFQLVRARIR
jgi:DNA-binding NtrC family response regulator